MLLLGWGAANGLAAHPLHTTLTQLRYRPADATVRIALRVFADDFDAAVARAAEQNRAIGAAASPALAYLGTHFALQGPDQRRIQLRFAGSRRQGEVRWIYLRGPAPVGVAGSVLRNTLFFDLFSDQVNIVQAETGGSRQTVLFTPGAGVKSLR